MNKADKQKIYRMLDCAVKSFLDFRENQHGNNRPCINREILARQGSAFTLADYLYTHGFISWEECCEYWCKVEMIDEDENCTFDCGANIGGKCKYAVERNRQWDRKEEPETINPGGGQNGHDT